MQPRRRCPSDLSDARWELIRPTLQARRNARARIRRPTHDLRDLMDAILYVDRTGIPWRYLPHDFPPHQTVYGYFAKWETDGIFDQLTGLLRRLVREREGRDAHPSACMLDSQSVKTSANVHLTGQGYDAVKKIAGRKRHIVTDTLGLLLSVLVTSAAVHDSTAGTHLLDQIAAHHPRVTKARADSRTQERRHRTRRHPRHRPQSRPPHPGSHTCTVQPRRWGIERTPGWLMHHRRLARDYETHQHRSAAMIRIAAIDLMNRRITDQYRAGATAVPVPSPPRRPGRGVRYEPGGRSCGAPPSVRLIRLALARGCDGIRGNGGGSPACILLTFFEKTSAPTLRPRSSVPGRRGGESPVARCRVRAAAPYPDRVRGQGVHGAGRRNTTGAASA
ncbi:MULTISPECIES: IS5 family transposase [Streptomyces]|uniref:IS5 family transposase n=1 Tax=Streptomyces TaxID=1883 RepID=UPI00198ED455|nr:hypothetical protein GCM10010236_76010 [Streptomyces eurythermus]